LGLVFLFFLALMLLTQEILELGVNILPFFKI
jgi:hypothetical protein